MATALLQGVPTMAAYTACSAAAMGTVTLLAYREWRMFLPTVLALQNHQISALVVFNFFLSLAYLTFKAVQLLFFGPLRTLESERLYERTWFAVTETIFAMSLFRNSLDTFFVIHLTGMVLTKSWHWILGDRVDYMEQAGAQPRLWHVRLNGIAALLCTIDAAMVCYTLPLALAGPNMLIFFGVEYVIMAANLLTSYCKYLLHSRDAGSDVPWENKSMYLFYLEVFSDLSKLAAYTFFCVSIYRHYGLPLYLVRDVYMITRSAVGRIRDVYNYRKATRELDRRFPDVSADEVRRGDSLCVVCREDMLEERDEAEVAAAGLAGAPASRGGPADPYRPKRLPCGHIFHYHCLRSWLERQQVCPTCRRSVMDPAPPSPPTPSAPREQQQQQPRDSEGPNNRPARDTFGNGSPGDGNFGNGSHGDGNFGSGSSAEGTFHRRNGSSAEGVFRNSSVPPPEAYASLAPMLTPLIPLSDLSGDPAAALGPAATFSVPPFVPLPFAEDEVAAASAAAPSSAAQMRANVLHRLEYVRSLDRKLTEVMLGLHSYLLAAEHGIPPAPPHVHKEEDVEKRKDDKGKAPLRRDEAGPSVFVGAEPPASPL